MISKKSLQILSTLFESPFLPQTIADIKKESKESSYSTLTKATKEWKKENIVFSTQRGKNIFYTPQLEKEETLQYITMSNLERLPKKVKENIRILQNSLTQHNIG